MTEISQRIERSGLLLAALLLAAPAVRACDPPKPGQVRVSVLIIFASEKDENVSKKLECIAREARKTYPKFKGFRMGELKIKSLKVGKPHKFDLGDGQKVCVTIERA